MSKSFIRAVRALLVIAFLSPLSAQPLGPAAANVTSIDRMTAMPFTAITITGSGFEASGLLVEFFGGDRLAVKMVPLSVTPTSVRVAVPVYIGGLGIGSGTVSVRIVNINRDGSLASGSNTITGFRIQAPPVPSSFNGQMTVNFLKAVRTFATDTLRPRLRSSTLGTSAMSTNLDTLIANLDGLIGRAEPLIAANANRFSLGYIGGRDALVDQDAIGYTEELLTAVLAWHAVATVGTTTTPACGVDEAKAALDEATRRANPDAARFVAYLAAGLNSARAARLTARKRDSASSTAPPTPRSASSPAAQRARSKALPCRHSAWPTPRRCSRMKRSRSVSPSDRRRNATSSKCNRRGIG